MPTTDDRTPSEVATVLFERLDAGDWTGVAALHTREFLEEFRTRTARWYAPSRPPTVEIMMTHDPEMPRPVAEYLVEKASKQHREGSDWGLAHPLSPEETEKLSAEELYALHVEGTDSRTRLRRMLEALKEKYPQYADQLEEKKNAVQSPWRVRFLGHLIQGDRAYVLWYGRLPRPDEPWDISPEILVMRRTSEGWRVSQDVGFGARSALIGTQVENEDGEVITLHP